MGLIAKELTATLKVVAKVKTVDEFIGNMSAGQVWNYLRNEHPEYFEKEGN